MITETSMNPDNERRALLDATAHAVAIGCDHGVLHVVLRWVHQRTTVVLCNSEQFVSWIHGSGTRCCVIFHKLSGHLDIVGIAFLSFESKNKLVLFSTNPHGGYFLGIEMLMWNVNGWRVVYYIWVNLERAIRGRYRGAREASLTSTKERASSAWRLYVEYWCTMVGSGRNVIWWKGAKLSGSWSCWLVEFP